MTPGKIEWKDADSYCRCNQLETGLPKDFEDGEIIVVEKRFEGVSSSSDFTAQVKVDMLRGFMKMDSREKDGQNTIDVSAVNDGTSIVHCVERFFKNPQQNYEVPLQLLQEWFSDTSLLRRQELAKLLFALLEEQGLNMELVTDPLHDYESVGKSDAVYLEESSQEKPLEEMVVDSQLKLSNVLDQCEEISEESTSKRWPNQALISDPIVLKSLREFRPVAYKPKQDSFLDSVSRKMQFSKLANDSDMIITVVDGSSTWDKQTGTSDIGVNTKLDIIHSNIGRNFGGSNVGISSDFPLASKERKTRFTIIERRPMISKFGSEPCLTATARLKDKLRISAGNRSLKKSKSVPSMKFVEHLDELPPLTPISVPRRNTIMTGKSNGVIVDRQKPMEVKVTVFNSSASPVLTPSKARTTFVEMSHAEFIKRQMILNERVSFRQGIRLGSQIVCVPELVSCSAPHVEKPAPPLLLHSNFDLKRARTPVDMKISTEHVVVSQSTSSHTIHYAPSPNHIVPPPTHITADKCSVVYVRESHPQPVLVASTSPTPTWQEQARKKPIIAYAKRKQSEVREKPIGSDTAFADNMKVLVSPNGVLNDIELTNVRTPSKVGDCEATSSESDVFVKRSEDKECPVISIPDEPVKPTLPKFNQTFVQNFQLKPVQSPPESVITQEDSTLDINRKLSKKLSANFNSVAHTETSIAVEEPVSSEACPPQAIPTGVITSTMPVPSPPIVVDRPVQVKSLPSSPTQVGLLIYTQGSSEESAAVPTLLLTTLPNGSAYCVRLPANTTLSSTSASQLDPSRPLVMQASLATSVTVKTPTKKLDSISDSTPVESNKVSLLQDLREFEKVFEETKLQFEKEQQLNVGDSESPTKPDMSPTQQQPLSSGCIPTVIPKFDCEKVVVGVKRKPDGELPVVTRLYTTAKKPLIVVTNYGQAVSQRPLIASQTPIAITHLPSKISKGKSRSGKTYPNPSKSPPSTKPQQKPQEDEKTQQKIYAILEEYAVQKEHSPDTNNRPAPRRRSNPPSASASKKKRPVIKSKDSGGETEDSNFSEM